MKKSDFEKKCKELEDEGYALVTFEPALKYAVYERGNTVIEVGRKKR